MSHEWNCCCRRCQDDEVIDLTLTGAIDEPRSPAEEEYDRRNQHTDDVVLPGLRAAR